MTAAPVSLDEQVRRTRERASADPGGPAVGDLVTLLLARGHLALCEDRDAAATADYEEAAGWLAASVGASPVNVTTERMVWASWAARARHEGRLDEALAAARRAVALREGLPVDDLQPYAGFYMDLKHLTTDLADAGRPEERVEAARLAHDWSRALAAAAEKYERTTGITGWLLAEALGDAGRDEEAIEVAFAVLPVLRRGDLGAIAVTLLGHLGRWLREAGRWVEAVDAEREALDLVRGRTHRRALVEIHLLQALARSLVGAGRTAEARGVLDEALEVAARPDRGVVALRPDESTAAVDSVRAQRASLDSTT